MRNRTSCRRYMSYLGSSPVAETKTFRYHLRLLRACFAGILHPASVASVSPSAVRHSPLNRYSRQSLSHHYRCTVVEHHTLHPFVDPVRHSLNMEVVDLGCCTRLVAVGRRRRTGGCCG